MMFTAALIIIAAGTFKDALRLFQFPVAVGLDGYYYVQQLAKLRDTGQLYYRSHTPIIFWLLRGIGLFIPSNIAAVKVASLVISAALAIVVSLTAFKISREPLAASISAAIMAWTTLHLFVVSEFLKQAGGYLFLAIGILIFLSVNRGTVRYVAALPFVVVGIFTHVSVIAWIAVAVIAGALLNLLLERRLSAAWFASAVLAISAVPCIVALQPFITIPKLIQSNITASPHWPIASIGVAENIGLLLTTVIALPLVVARRKTLSGVEVYVYGIVSTFSLWVTFNPFLQHRLGSNSIAVRMQDLAQVQLAILLPGVLLLCFDRLPHRVIWCSACCIALLISVRQFDKTPHGITNSYLSERVQIADVLSNLKGTVSPPIVAEHGDEFMATYYLQVEVEHSLPEGHSWSEASWILRAYPCGMADEGDAKVLVRSGGKCTVLIRGAILARQFSEMRFTEQITLVRNNRHLYYAFHPNEA